VRLHSGLQAWYDAPVLIELLIVAAILLYLNSIGFLNYDDPWAIAISIVILVFVGTISFIITHWVARSLVDGLFGFGSWTPKETKKKPDKREEFHGPADNVEWLEEQIKKQPANVALSKRLSDLYMESGQADQFILERVRITREGKLSAGEMAAILNRLADMELDRSQPENAIAHLKEITLKFPDTNEGRNARVRIGVIQEHVASVRAGESSDD
jgi:hypothetical protein